MNRSHYFDYIEEQLSTLSTRIESRGKLNILDLHLHSENFYMHFINKLFGWQLENMNAFEHNIEAIDLKDSKRKIVAQVSATATKQKIESALGKDLSSYVGFCFKFISISKDAGDLREKTYKNPHKLAFTPPTDIYDKKSILSKILALDIESQYNFYDFIKKELGKTADPTKVETNLAKVINILAAEDWSVFTGEYQTKLFEIDRKIDHNNLGASKDLVRDYAAHHHRVDQIYQAFNKQGVNKSNSVLESIRNMYLRSADMLSNDALFFNVIGQVRQRVEDSANYIPLAFEELEMCINILVVDAFIRCKIFVNPEGYVYATT